ncbi:MAG: pyridoxal phosphate-dependent aminotransferase [Eubacterium sp.]|nr:pyridoxal phosphate-dependent aminotransferase [Candidatus Colimonas fimequi]
MKYDFNEIIERRGTGAYKYDAWEANGVPEDALPLWVADMDIKAPEAVNARIRELTEHGIYGYTGPTEGYYLAVQNWFKSRFDWDIEKNWIVQTPGVVYALATAVRAFTKPGDGVVIQQPVYYPFRNVIVNNDRKLVVNELIYQDGAYTMNFEDLEEKLADENTKLMILCSPHNPVSRVWTKEELAKVAELCVKNKVKLVSDEIHCDFTYGEHVHTPMATISDEIRDCGVFCTAPSKTFNIAGLQVSNIIIPNREMRHAFRDIMKGEGLGGLNMIGVAACQAAYEEGAEWLEQLKVHLQGNIDYINQFVAEKLPEIKVIETQGTYLVWLDVSGLGFKDKVDQNNFIVNQAKLWLDTGSMFGDAGIGFERINVAAPRATIVEAMNRLEAAIARRRESL